jgi:hypothetical protein
MMVDCCALAIMRVAPHLVNLDLSVDAPKQEIFRTLRRADGSEICGEYAFMVALDDNDWAAADEDAFDLDEQKEYWLDTWVLVRRQSRMLGPEPLDEDEDDDDDVNERREEPGADQGAV